SGNLKQPHTINPRRCVECGVCGNICAVGAILKPDGSVAEKVSKSDWLTPSIDRDMCSACGLCVEACRFGCLEISPPQFKGDFKVHALLCPQKKCVGCGICAASCPVKAITMKRGSEQ
ncbi:MAG: 4Fe-4S binding protein, partial [Oscillospiraceae bacterium]